MPLTTIDPTPALVVIDLQKGLAAFQTVHPIASIVQNAARLAHAFRRAGAVVVLVNVTGMAPGRTDNPRFAFTPTADWAELLPELDVQPKDVLVTKETWGAFHGTSLDADLRARGVTQIVLAGVSTSAGVESTARAAYEHGYHVVLATDAMTDLDAAAHDHTIARIFPKLGETATTDEIIAMLERQAPA
jgi:nicotinamidase-related amidase